MFLSVVHLFSSTLYLHSDLHSFFHVDSAKGNTCCAFAEPGVLPPGDIPFLPQDRAQVGRGPSRPRPSSHVSRTRQRRARTKLQIQKQVQRCRAHTFFFKKKQQRTNHTSYNDKHEHLLQRNARNPNTPETTHRTGTFGPNTRRLFFCARACLCNFETTMLGRSGWCRALMLDPFTWTPRQRKDFNARDSQKRVAK